MEVREIQRYCLHNRGKLAFAFSSNIRVEPDIRTLILVALTPCACTPTTTNSSRSLLRNTDSRMSDSIARAPWAAFSTPRSCAACVSEFVGSMCPCCVCGRVCCDDLDARFKRQVFVLQHFAERRHTLGFGVSFVRRYWRRRRVCLGLALVVQAHFLHRDQFQQPTMPSGDLCSVNDASTHGCQISSDLPATRHAWRSSSLESLAAAVGVVKVIMTSRMT